MPLLPLPKAEQLRTAALFVQYIPLMVLFRAVQSLTVVLSPAQTPALPLFSTFTPLIRDALPNKLMPLLRHWDSEPFNTVIRS